MNLLLIYPKPAETSKSRLSRTDAQLNGIAHCARSVLIELEEQNQYLVVKEIGVASAASIRPGRSSFDAVANDELQQLMSESDVILNVASSPTAHDVTGDHDSAVIHLCPAFPGSFACNDIFFKAGGTISQVDLDNTITATRTPFESEKPRTHELDASMHYAAFTPLPARVEEAFYRNERDHALVFLSYPQNESDDIIREQDKATLADMLHATEALRSLTFVCESLAELPKVKEVADAIATGLGLTPKIWGLRKGDFHDMFSVMAKADLVLFGGNSLYADAIIRGKPALTWRTAQQNTDSINDAYYAFLDHQNREQLQAEQRKELDALFKEQYKSGALPNHRICFETILAEVLCKAMPKMTPLDEIQTAGKPAGVIPEAKLAPRQTLSETISQSVWSKRQKIAQFRDGLASTAAAHDGNESRVYMRVR